MISNQILQTTLDGLKGITRVDLGICDTEGKVLASTFTDAEESESSYSGICRFTGRQSGDPGISVL